MIGYTKTLGFWDFGIRTWPYYNRLAVDNVKPIWIYCFSEAEHHKFSANYSSLQELLVMDHGPHNEVNFESKFFEPSRTFTVLVFRLFPI